MNGPEVNFETSPKTSASTAQRFRMYLRDSRKRCFEAHSRARKNWEFAAPDADQGTAISSASSVADWMPKPVALNDIWPQLEASSAREATARHREVISGSDETLDGVAEVSNRYIEAELGGEESEITDSDLFLDLQVQAIACASCRKSHRNSRIARTEYELVPIYEMLWDMQAKKKNLEDREWHIRGSWWRRERFDRVFPEHRNKRFSDTSFGGAAGMYERLDDGAGDSVWGNLGARQHADGPSDDVLVTYMEWKESEVAHEVELPGLQVPLDQAIAYAAQQGVEIQPPTDLFSEITTRSQLQSMVGEGPPEFREVEFEEIELLQELWAAEFEGAEFDGYVAIDRDLYRYAWLGFGEELEEGDLPENAFTLLFLTGTPVRYKDRTEWRSRVDLMRDPQIWKNRGANLWIQILATQGKGTFGFLPGTFANEDEARAQIAAVGGMVKMRNPDGIVQFPRSTAPPLGDVISFFDDAVLRQGGESAYSVGGVQDARRTSSKTVSSLQAAGANRISHMFDSLRLFRKQRARLMMRQMTAYHTPDELREIVGPKVATHVPDDFDTINDVTRMRVQIDEAPLSGDERQATLEMMLNSQLFQLFAQLGYSPPPDVMLELLGGVLSEDMKQKWLQHVRMMQQAMQQQPPEQ